MLAPARGDERTGVSDDPLPPRSVEQVFQRYGISHPENSNGFIRLTLPDVAENGAFVPVAMDVQLPDTRLVLLVSEKNYFPLLTVAEFESGAQPWLETRVRLAEGENRVVVFALSKHRWFYESRRVNVITGGCWAGNQG